MTGSTTVGWIDQMILIIGTREGCTAARVRTRYRQWHCTVITVVGRPDVGLVPDV